MKLVTAALCLLAVATAPGAARANSAVETRIRAALPADLALAELTIPGTVGKDTSVVWTRPPRAGRVTILREDGPRRLWARALLVPVRPVLVAGRALRKGERVAAGDLGREARPDEGQALQILPVGVAGAEVLRDVAAGATLAEADLALPPPLERGAELTIVVRRGGARVTAAAVLERAARPGERTTARMGQRLVTGVLVDAHTLEVSP